jgi:hypothetical protein
LSVKIDISNEKYFGFSIKDSAGKYIDIVNLILAWIRKGPSPF